MATPLAKPLLLIRSLVPAESSSQLAVAPVDALYRKAGLPELAEHRWSGVLGSRLATMCGMADATSLRSIGGSASTSPIASCALNLEPCHGPSNDPGTDSGSKTHRSPMKHLC